MSKGVKSFAAPAQRSVLRLVATYTALSLGWIYTSDWLVDALVSSPHTRSIIQSCKGTGFVLAIAALLFFSLRSLVHKAEEAKNQEVAARLELVTRLALAAEYRDDATGRHDYRISRYAEIIGRAMGLESSFVDVLFYAASLHDIGKIALPDAILLKPGPLTEEERATMQKHVVHGATLLSGSSDRLMQVAYSAALTHHERWDGTGYPSGLKGEEIPIEGRIVAVCDVFDALISERPYKVAWSFEEAVAEIRRLSGVAFSPDVVQAFYSSLPLIKAAMEESPDQRWMFDRSRAIGLREPAAEISRLSTAMP